MGTHDAYPAGVVDPNQAISIYLQVPNEKATQLGSALKFSEKLALFIYDHNAAWGRAYHAVAGFQPDRVGNERRLQELIYSGSEWDYFSSFVKPETVVRRRPESLAGG